MIHSIISQSNVNPFIKISEKKIKFNNEYLKIKKAYILNLHNESLSNQFGIIDGVAIYRNRNFRNFIKNLLCKDWYRIYAYVGSRRKKMDSRKN